MLNPYSAGIDDFSHQILTSKVDPRTEIKELKDL